MRTTRGPEPEHDDGPREGADDNAYATANASTALRAVPTLSCPDCGRRWCRCAAIGVAAEIDLAAVRFAAVDPAREIEEAVRRLLDRALDTRSHRRPELVRSAAAQLVEVTARHAREAAELHRLADALVAAVDLEAAA